MRRVLTGLIPACHTPFSADGELDLARTLVAVVDAGTLDAAAQRLRITPSAVSQRLKALEQQLGRVLLVRSKPVAVTDAGASVVRLARQLALLEHDVLAELAIVLARLFGRGGNRVGALLYDTGTLCTVPPGTGRRHVLRIGAELDRTTGIRRGDTTDLAAMLDAAGRLARRRSLIIVISDFIGDGDWERSLLRLARRRQHGAGQHGQRPACGGHGLPPGRRVS